MQRLETGVVDCPDDWPGIFIRGDNALGYAIHLAIVLENDTISGFEKASLKGLLDLLTSCNARTAQNIQKIQRVEDDD